jgi:SNF2 family DNA or RNA helicase
MEHKQNHGPFLVLAPLSTLSNWVNETNKLWSLLNFLLRTIFNSMEAFDEWFNKPFASFKNPSAAASVPQQLHG